MLLPAFYLIFRVPSEKTCNIWMEAIELALKSTNNLSFDMNLNTNTTTTPTTPVLTSPNNTNQTVEKLNESFKSQRSDTFNSIKSSHSSLTNSSTTKKCSNSNRQKSKRIKTKNQKRDLDESNNNNNININNKNSSGADNELDEDLGSMNSSLMNNEDEFLDDEEELDYEEEEEDDDDNDNDEMDDAEDDEYDDAFLIDSKSNNQSLGEQDNCTKYVESPKEEFGEVNISFYKIFISLVKQNSKKISRFKAKKSATKTRV